MISKEKLEEINSLRQEIDSHGKLPADVLKRINYKLRLEWNYTSNNMEGNTLTRDETRSVMVGNIDVQGKPIKDLLEMKGHDDVISKIIEIGKGELNLSEARIREIHKGIMHEEGVEKAKMIGVWKTKHNMLYDYRGEKIEFTPPAEVTERMHELINWLNTVKEKIDRADKTALHPADIAFKFHLDYVTIHPFYDGNGRTARIFTNLILIAYGYPPVYIKTSEKDIYGNYLGDIQGYGGNPDLFYDFMAGLLIRSLQLTLDAIIGKSIEDPDDVDKEIEMLMREIKLKNSKNQKPDHSIKIDYFWKTIFPFFERAIKELSQFDELFFKKSVQIFASESGENEFNLSGAGSKKEMNSVLSELSALNYVRLVIIWEGYKYKKSEYITEEKSLKIFFNEAGIQINGVEKYNLAEGEINRRIMTKLYMEELSENEKKQHINELKKEVIYKIKKLAESEK